MSSPKIRESLYYIGTIIPAVLGLAMIWGGFDAGAADNIGDILAGILALAGASAPATAAVKVNQQRKDGTFTPVNPADAVVNGAQAVLAAAATANAEVERVKAAVTDVANAGINIVPGLGPLASQLISAVPQANVWSRQFNDAVNLPVFPYPPGH